MPQRPTSPEDFMRWSDAATCGIFNDKTESWYKTSQNNLFAQTQDLSFFSGLADHLDAVADTYRIRCSSELFAHRRSPKPEWKKKPYHSFVRKAAN
jgi:hypothetical protein